MENKLKHLKNNMDKTIFEDISFNMDHQQNVLRTIKKSKSRNKRFIFRDRFNGVLSIAVTSCLFLGIAYFVGTKTHLLNGGQGRITEGTQQESHVVKTVYTPPKLDENFKDMTKEEVLNKMTTTIHNFETAKGQFKVNYDNTPAGYILVDYEISLNHNVGSYDKERNLVTNDENSLVYNDSSIYMIDNRYRIYKGGNARINAGQKPPVNGEMVRTLFPEYIATDLKKDLSNWEIEKQNEMVLRHNTIVIKGKFFNSGESNSFRYWVDKDTGILLKEEVYNSSGKVVDYLYPTNLEINVPVDRKDFIPNLEGYTKTDDMGMERIKRQSDPVIVTGNIDKQVPQELTKQWEQAKKNPDETAIFHLNDNWYIFVKKGYLVDHIDKQGVLHLSKTSSQKSQYNFEAWAKGYKFDQLKIVYEKN
jgi:outer membrane lipoprotein-sorting protein